MSLAIAYGMKNRAKHMAQGGPCDEHGTHMCQMCHGGKMMAKGGFVHEEEASGYEGMPQEHPKKNHSAMHMDDRMLNQHGADEMGAMGTEQDSEPEHERMVEHPVENQSDHEDMVGRIMKNRAMHFSKGGRVANETPIMADFEDNDFDDLAKRDDLESSYTGANSGDKDGDMQEDEDRRDIVARIMKSRKLRDRGGSGSNERI